MKQLLLDLAQLADEHRIHKIVSKHLASYGEVTSLKVLDVPEQDHRLILITMDSPQAAALAINSLGLSSFGERSLVIAVPNGLG